MNIENNLIDYENVKYFYQKKKQLDNSKKYQI